MKLIIFFLLLLFLPPVILGADSVDSVGTDVNVLATTTVVSSRVTRRLLLLQNKSDAPIYCNISGAAAVVGEGIILNPYLTSGQAGTTIGFDATIPTRPINCIHNSSGSKVLHIEEG